MTPGEIVPPGPAVLWYELREELGVGTHEQPPRVRDLGERLGVRGEQITRWLHVLGAVGLVERGPWSGKPGDRRSLTINDTANTDARFHPCNRCYQRAKHGKWCAHCKQLMRSDRKWRAAAVRMAQRGDGEMKIYLALVKKWPDLTLYDKPSDEEDGKSKPGVISVLRDAGLASGDWIEGQRARQAGGSEEW